MLLARIQAVAASHTPATTHVAVEVEGRQPPSSWDLQVHAAAPPRPPPPPPRTTRTLVQALHLGVCALFASLETADAKRKALHKLGFAALVLLLTVLFWRELVFWGLVAGAGLLLTLLYKL